MRRVPLVTGAFNIIEQLRKTQGVTRTELAGRLAVSTAYVTQTLNSSRNMTLNTVEAFADALGAEVEITARLKGGKRWAKQAGRLLPRSSKKRTRKTRSSV